MRAPLPAAHKASYARESALPKPSTAHPYRAIRGSADESGEHATAHASMPVPKGTVKYSASSLPPPLPRAPVANEQRTPRVSVPRASEPRTTVTATTTGRVPAARFARSPDRDVEEAEWRALRDRAREEEEREWRALRARVEEDEWKALRERARIAEEAEWAQLIAEAKTRATLTIADVNDDRAWQEHIARAKSGIQPRASAPSAPGRTMMHPFDAPPSAGPLAKASAEPVAQRPSVHPFEAASPAAAPAPKARVVYWP